MQLYVVYVVHMGRNHVFLISRQDVHHSGEAGGVNCLSRMATHGHVGEFEPDNESIVAYLKWVQLYFDASGVKEKRKVPVLLSIIGPKTYGVLGNLLAPESPRDKTLHVFLILRRDTTPFYMYMHVQCMYMYTVYMYVTM